MGLSVIIEDGILKEYKSDDLDVIVPEGVTQIGEAVFLGSKIESVKIPSSVIAIGYKAFHECINLKRVFFSKGLEVIGDYAFCGNGCESISIPNSVKVIEEYAFCDCSNLKKVVIPKSVEIIERNAFSMNDKLKDVTIPKRFKDSLDSIFNRIDGINFVFK